MVKRKSLFLLFIPISIILLMMTIIIGYSMWIISEQTSIETKEVTGLVDDDLKDYNLEFDFTYNRYTQNPTIGLTSDEFTSFESKFDITYYRKDKDGLTKVSSTTGAGDYLVEYYNKSSHIVTQYEYKINKYVLVINMPSSFDAIFYSDNITINENDFSVSGVNQDIINGYFTFNVTDEIINDGSTQDSHGIKVDYNYTITSMNASNYEIVPGEFNIPLKSVAKITTDTETKYYHRVESALKVAQETNGAQTVEVISGLSVNLFEDVTISSGDSLYIPIKPHEKTDASKIPAITFGDEITGYSLYGRNCISTADTNLIFKNNSTLHNYGSLIINGIVSGGGGGHISGHTSANYGLITLRSGKIISYPASSITCYGYIIGSNPLNVKNDAQIIMQNGSTMTMPFIVDEHRGGSLFLKMAGGLSAVVNPAFETAPFNRFHFNNIETDILFSYGSRLSGRADLYANEKHNITFVNVLGPSGGIDYLLSIEQNSYVKVKYTHSTEKINIDIYGNAKLNPLSLTLRIKYGITITVNLSTSGLLFPISWYYDISIHPLDQNSTSIFTLTSQDIKLLPGASLNIDKGVTVYAGTIAVYETFTDTVASPNYPSMPPAKLNVNGTLECNTLSGIVTTNDLDAKLIVSNIETNTKELLENGDNLYYDVSLKLSLPIFNETESTSSLVDATSGGVYGVLNQYNDEYDSYCWELYDDYSSYVITFDTGISTLPTYSTTVYVVPSNSYFVINEGILPQDNRYNYPGWELIGWTYNGEEAINQSINGNITLTAVWQKKNYDIVYLIYDKDGNIIEGDSISFTPLITEFNAETALSEIPTPTHINQLVFSGWYLDTSENITHKISSISGDLLNNEQIYNYITDTNALLLYAYFDTLSYNLVQYQDEEGKILHSELIQSGGAHTVLSDTFGITTSYFEHRTTDRGQGNHFVFRNAWLTSSNEYAIGSTINITSDIVLKPKFTEEIYTLTLKNNVTLVNIDSSGSNQYQVFIGETVTVRNSTRYNYTLYMDGSDPITINQGTYIYITTIPTNTEISTITGSGSIQ